MSTWEPGSVWFYAPNKIAPIVFCVLFTLSGIVHAWQTYRYKSWRYTLLMPWAALMMTAGFATREAGAYDNSNLAYIIASTVLIMSGPPVYAVVNYFILSRMLYYIPYLSPLHPGRVVTTFVGIDAIIEILIANGAWRMVHSELSSTERKVGEDMTKAALLLQSVMFVLFIILAAIFQRSASRANVLPKRFTTILIVLYTSSVIVLARCIYRIVEFFQGYTGTLYTNEPYFWVFEASIMLINTLILNIWHPGSRLPRDNGVFLARDGFTERAGPGWADDRHFLATMFDPFDLYSIIARKQPVEFWDFSDEQLAAMTEEKRAKTAGKLSTRMAAWMDGEKAQKEKEGDDDAV